MSALKGSETVDSRRVGPRIESRILVESEILSAGSEMHGRGCWSVRDGWLEVSRPSHRKLNFGRIRNFE